VDADVTVGRIVAVGTLALVPARELDVPQPASSMASSDKLIHRPRIHVLFIASSWRGKPRRAA
jgi:hypothetical protein